MKLGELIGQLRSSVRFRYFRSKWLDHNRRLGYQSEYCCRNRKSLHSQSSNGERWNYDLGDLVSTPEWQQVIVPFDSELWYESGGKADDRMLTLNRVFELRMYSDNPKRPITVYMGPIEVIREAVQ